MSSLLTVLAATIFTLSCSCAQANEQAIAEVASGRLKEARASWWGFDATDATKCLQAAIASKVPKLIVDNVGQPWIVEPINLVGNQEIVFENGVEVLAKANAFKGTNDSLFTAKLIDHVTLTGYGATLRMRRSDYDNPTRYKKGEWRHILRFLSCSHVEVTGLTLAESGGDGIYLGTGQPGVTNKDVRIKDVICDKNYRQGISVITAENLLIENTILRETAGTAPMAGIDFEPNKADERIVNCVMRNCVALGNKGWGYKAYLPSLHARSAPVSLRLENCKAIGNRAGAFGFTTGNAAEAAVSGTLDLVDCEFRGNGGAAFALGENPPPPVGCRITLSNCAFFDNAALSPAQAPIVFSASRGANRGFGGVQFVDVLIRDPVVRNPMLLVSRPGGLLRADITGNLILEKDGRKKNVELTEEVLARWMPVITFK